MKSSRITFIAWLLACLSDQSAGYSNGKVYESCDSMLPFHGESPQEFPKHTIEVNVTEFKPGDCVKGMNFCHGSLMVLTSSSQVFVLMFIVLYVCLIWWLFKVIRALQSDL